MLNPSISKIIAELAQCSFDARVIADRLGFAQPTTTTTASTAASTAGVGEDAEFIAPSIAPANLVDSGAVFVPMQIAALQTKIAKLQEMLQLLRSELSDKPEPTPMSDGQYTNFVEQFTKYLVECAPVQIEHFYNAAYFDKCEPHLRSIIAGLLSAEFQRRKLVPLDVWSNLL